MRTRWRCRGWRRSCSTWVWAKRRRTSRCMDPLVADLASIAGQKPVTTKAKKSIAAFKVREGMPIGAMVTLRGDKMYEFLDRLISIALPRVRDFRGVSTKSFDGRGNYTLGLRDQLIFAGDRLREGGQAEGHERHHRHHGEGRQRARALLKAVRHAVPHGSVLKRRDSVKQGYEDKRDMATTAKRVKDARKPKFKSSPAQPLPALRPSARVPAQVRRLPSVLPRAGAQGRDSGRREVKLVDVRSSLRKAAPTYSEPQQLAADRSRTGRSHKHLPLVLCCDTHRSSERGMKERE